MKKLLYCVLCLSAFAFAGVTVSAATPDVLNSYMEMQQFYDIMEVKSAPVSTSDAGTEIINGGSGNLIYEATDLTLPGKGGLDLEVKRKLNTHENADRSGSTQLITIENSFLGTEAGATTYKYVVRYYKEGDTAQTPVYIAYDGISHMLEAENGTNSIQVGADYTDYSEIAQDITTSSGSRILFSYDIEENAAGFTYGNYFYLYSNLPKENEVTLVRDLTVAPVKVTNHCTDIYEYGTGEYIDSGYPTGTAWVLDVPRMSFSDYLYYSADGQETWKGNGTFYDPELGKSLYYELTYTHETGEGYYVADFDLFSPTEDGSMHKDDVLKSAIYSVVIPDHNVGTDRRFEFKIVRYDGISYTMEGYLHVSPAFYFKAKSDAFGNTISYNKVGTSTTIVDTYGRTIRIDKDGITVNGQTCVTYEETVVNNDAVDPNGVIDYDDTYRLTVKKADSDGEGVTYGMRMAQDAYTIGEEGTYVPYTQTVPAETRLLDYVELGTGARTEYTYVRERDPMPQRKDDVVKRDYHKVLQRGLRTEESAALTERIQYSYVTEREEGEGPTRAVTKTFPDRPGYSEYEFYNNKGNLTLSEVSNTQEGNTYYIKTEKEYAYQREGNYLPVTSKVTTKQTKESSAATIVVTEYEYNGDQLITKETRDDEVIAITSYNEYGIPLEQFQKQNDSTWVGTVNTANMTKITSSKAAKKIGSAEAQAQTFEESTYVYNSSGDLIQSVEAGVTTNYGYSYTNYKASGTALKANSLTKTTTVEEVENTTNTDGTGSLTQDITVTEQYDWLGRLNKATDAKGGVTEYAYDLAGRLTQTTYPDDNTITNDYNDTTNEIVSTAEDGSKQKLTYDSAGRNEAGYLYDSATETWRLLYRNFYDGNGNLSEKRVYNDSGSEKSKMVYTYYNDGQLKSEIAYEGEAVLSRRELGYEPFQSVGRSNTYAKVYTTSSGYLTANQTVDKYGRRVSDTLQADNSSYVQSYTTDTIGNILTIKDFKANADSADSPTVTYTYDYANRQVQATTAAGQTKVVYDELGRIDYEQDANGNQVYCDYNGSGNIIRIRQQIDDDTWGETNRYYDVNGNLSREETVQSGETYSSTRYVYDSRNRPMAVATAAEDGDMITKYEYDAAGRITKQATGLSSVSEAIDSSKHAVISNTYDSMGRLTATTDALGQTTSYQYSILGELLSETDRNGTVKTYTYDGLGRVKQLLAAGEGADSETVSYLYDLMGNLTQMVDSKGTTTYNYNNRGLLTSETRGGVTKNYEYDANGNRTLLTVGSMEVSYTYDGLNRLVSLTDNDNTTSYTYDANGNVLSETTDGGRSVTYSYNQINALTSKTNSENGSVLDNYSLDYYADGNIKSVTENGQTTQYTYDRAGRLVREEGPDGAQAYQYDVFGNRAGMEVYNTNDIKSARTMYSYDKNNRLLNAVTTYVDGTTQREDYTYDANGNRTMKTASGTTKKYDYAQVTAGEGNGYGVTMYSYDALGRMTGMQSGTTTASYTYDGAGLRQSKTVNGVTTSYVYDGTNIVREGSTYYTRGAAGLVSKKSGASVDYYYTDYHGSVVRCGDEAYSYDAFGNQTSETEDSNPFRYSGEYYDAETGLIYLRARYYDSGVGAFTSEDPAKDGLNWYVYCGGNPVNLWDPTGLASYVVVLAAGINSNSSSDYFYWLKNEIQYRMNTQGDTVRFLEVYPYGEVDGANFVKQITQVSGQASQVLSDANYKTRAGADYVNWKITEANVQEDETIIMIGHSGGGTAITGAYYYMDDKHKQKVSQIVTIGSPQMMILSKSQQAKTTRITDNNDIIPKIGNDFGAFANYRYTVNNGYNNEIQAHVTYFNTAQKAAHILNFFWGRAMRW